MSGAAERNPIPAAGAAAERRLRDLIAGAYTLPAILVAHELRLFGLLAKGPRTVPQICEALRLKQRPAEALLAVCAAAGLVSGGAKGYVLQPLAAEFFLPESPTSFGDYWDMMIESSRLYTFAGVKEAILSDGPPQAAGGPAPAAATGPAKTRSITRAMESRGKTSSRVWPGLVELSRHRVFLDIGGGSGIHSIGAIRRWPNLQAVVLDLPDVCEAAAECIARHGLGDRIRTSPGDFRDGAPFPAADVHFYSEVLHNRSPDECKDLLARSFLDLPPDGLLLVHEMLFDEKLEGPAAVAAANLNMLLRTRGGRQYSRPELFALLQECGYRDLRSAPASGYFSLVSATKPGPSEGARSAGR